MNEEAYRDRSGTDLWIGSDWIWHPELQMRSANVWDMTPRHKTLLNQILLCSLNSNIVVKLINNFLVIPKSLHLLATLMSVNTLGNLIIGWPAALGMHISQ
jgi:hypothetical protein